MQWSSRERHANRTSLGGRRAVQQVIGLLAQRCIAAFGDGNQNRKAAGMGDDIGQFLPSRQFESGSPHPDW
jgi:hypothetical protein